MPAIEMEGGAVPEAKLLFSMLRDICVVCSKSRADLKPHHCLRAKLASFAFSRTVRSPCAQNTATSCTRIATARATARARLTRSAAAGRKPGQRRLLHPAPDQPLLRLYATPAASALRSNRNA